MALMLQPATLDDVLSIVQLLALIWPHQPANPEQVAIALATPGQVTSLAAIQEQVVGLVSGFPTVSAAGQLRWEVDLLAVHPAYRGQQIGRHLVQRCTAAARAAQAHLARALVATDNRASQQTFAAVGYHRHPEHLSLYTTTTHLPSQVATGAHIHLIPVHTLSYSGAWLEGSLTRDAVQEACARQVGEQWSSLGLLVPQSQAQTHDIVRQSGFVCRGEYDWWLKPE